MQFIDEAKIEVKAGKGGAGASHFRREKYVPYGGPDGGNGGQGGSVYLLADRNKQTLLDFKFRPIWRAKNGQPGAGSGKDGACGEDLYVHVPVGTQVLNEDGVVADLESDGQKYRIARGGRGGKGNAFFKSATNQAPHYAQPGEDGQEGSFQLSLKLVADVGLLGFPNAGKSTLISRISGAKPKIADYPFTTLVPNLGVVPLRDNRSCVVADIPGLIEGAHSGKGLGVRFLKHVERTGVLVHLVDPMRVDDNGEMCDPLESMQTINNELARFSAELASKPQIVVFSKSDCWSEEENRISAAIAVIKSKNIQFLSISSVSGEGLQELKDCVDDLLRTE